MGAEEIHRGGKGGLEPPGGEGTATGGCKGWRGDSMVCSDPIQCVMMCMNGPGQTGKAPLGHHPQLWRGK